MEVFYFEKMAIIIVCDVWNGGVSGAARGGC